MAEAEPGWCPLSALILKGPVGPEVYSKMYTLWILSLETLA